MRPYRPLIADPSDDNQTSPQSPKRMKHTPAETRTRELNRLRSGRSEDVANNTENVFVLRLAPRNAGLAKQLQERGQQPAVR